MNSPVNTHTTGEPLGVWASYDKWAQHNLGTALSEARAASTFANTRELHESAVEAPACVLR